MVFVVSFTFLLILLIFFVIGTEDIFYFSLFSPGEVNTTSNYFASSFMMKWLL